MQLSFDLLDLRTTDDVPLRTAFWAPAAAGFVGRIDALLLNPAGMGDFLHPVMRHLATRLSAAGLPCLTIDSRGRDMVWEVKPGRYAGNAFGTLAEGRFDIEAGFAELERRGFRRIGLLGHSLNGARCVWYTATQQDPRQACLITLSAPRLSDAFFDGSVEADAYRADRERARALLASAGPDTMFEAQFPYRSLFTAATFLDKYCSEAYDVVALAPEIRVPFLAVIGEHEHRLTLDGTSAAMVAAAVNAPSASEHVAPGAHHSYDGCEDALAARLLHWLQRPA